MNEAHFIKPAWQVPGNVRAFFTTRHQGMSKGVWESLNLGTHVEDDPAAVRENRARLASLLPQEPLWLNQQHGSHCIHAGDLDANLAANLAANSVAKNDDEENRQADACVTSEANQPLAVMVADCLPLLLARADGSMIAVVHVGWRGLEAGVIENTLAAMQGASSKSTQGRDEASSTEIANELVCWLGPHIRPCHYEVGEDVRSRFPGFDNFFSPSGKKSDQHCMMDLAGISRQKLIDAGISRIHDSELCTFCDSTRFFSYRRDGICGRMAAIIWRT